jgi:hypothetical protein
MNLLNHMVKMACEPIDHFITGLKYIFADRFLGRYPESVFTQRGDDITPMVHGGMALNRTIQTDLISKNDSSFGTKKAPGLTKHVFNGVQVLQ